MSNIVRWNPTDELLNVRQMMDRFFEAPWRSLTNGFDEDRLALDVHEDDHTYTVTTALPGVNPDDIEVKLENDVLMIAGETHQQRKEEDDNKRVLLQERRYGSFMRRIRLPQPVDADKIEAVVENGVLTLTLPKTEAAQPRKITVKANKQ